LVDRANTYAGNLSNPIGGDGTNTVALENTDDRVQHGLDRFACAALPGTATNLLRSCLKGHGVSIHKCEQITNNAHVL